MTSLKIVPQETLEQSLTRLDRGIDRLIADRDALLVALAMILPLAEDYLKKAPNHPDNAKLETARAAIVQARER